jgi:hypothetical protein
MYIEDVAGDSLTASLGIAGNLLRPADRPRGI